MKQFIEKNFVVIVLVVAILTLFKSCGDSRELSKIKKELNEIELHIIDIKTNTYTKEEFNVELIIMGLEAEKRMIQATDRKLLDVRRQSEVEDEIKTLRRNLK
jgi:hypothetical protein